MPFFRKKKIDKDYSASEARNLLEQFCAFRDRSEKETRQRMAELKLDSETAEQVMEQLENDGFIDDERFAIHFARGKFRSNHWGKIRIRQELSMNGISPRLIQKGLDEIDVDDYQKTLTDLLEKKWGQLDGEDNASQKLAAFAIRKGYEPGLVFEAAGRIRRGEG